MINLSKSSEKIASELTNSLCEGDTINFGSEISLSKSDKEISGVKVSITNVALTVNGLPVNYPVKSFFSKRFASSPAGDTELLKDFETRLESVAIPNGLVGQFGSIASMCGTLEPDTDYTVVRGSDVYALDVFVRRSEPSYATTLARSRKTSAIFLKKKIGDVTEKEKKESK